MTKTLCFFVRFHLVQVNLCENLINFVLYYPPSAHLPIGLISLLKWHLLDSVKGLQSYSLSWPTARGISYNFKGFYGDSDGNHPLGNVRVFDYSSHTFPFFESS